MVLPSPVNAKKPECPKPRPLIQNPEAPSRPENEESHKDTTPLLLLLKKQFKNMQKTNQHNTTSPESKGQQRKHTKPPHHADLTVRGFDV